MSYSGTTRCICTLATWLHVSPLSDTVLVPLIPWAQLNSNPYVWNSLYSRAVCQLIICSFKGKTGHFGIIAATLFCWNKIWLFPLHTMHLVCTLNLKTWFKFETETGGLSFSALARWRVPPRLSLMNSHFPPKLWLYQTVTLGLVLIT